MAINTNKRIPVKWVRDKAKSAYEKKSSCYICGCVGNLELHHLHSITLLLEKWAENKRYDISTDEGICAVREEFILEHHSELYDEVYTLCNPHHIALHGVYGKTPKPGSETRQARWIEIQKQKFSDVGDVVELSKIPKTSYGSFFSQFC